MSPALAAVLLALGVVGAFVSGLIGVGGAIVMIPLLLYAPPLLGFPALDVKSVAAMRSSAWLSAAHGGRPK